jgi:hypothetical protein
MADDVEDDLGLREFAKRRDGMIHAMNGGLWLHRHVWFGHRLVHLVSTDRNLLLEVGRRMGLGAERLQYKPLRDPRTSERRDAWHWDLPDHVTGIQGKDNR